MIVVEALAVIEALTPSISPPPNPTPSTVFTYFTAHEITFYILGRTLVVSISEFLYSDSCITSMARVLFLFIVILDIATYANGQCKLHSLKSSY